MKHYLAEHVGIVLLVSPIADQPVLDLPEFADISIALDAALGDDVKSLEWIPLNGSYAITLKANAARTIKELQQVCEQMFEKLRDDYLNRCARERDFDDSWYCNVARDDTCKWSRDNGYTCVHPHPTSLTPLTET